MSSQSETDLADDADEPERGPLRRCVVTRERGEKAAMVRFVLSPDRTVTPDLGARLPGRGIWLSARKDVLSTALTKGAFARASRGAVTIPPALLSDLVALLEGRIADHIGLARRAGQAVCGFQKAREWLGGQAPGGRVALVIQARDGSRDERARFLRSGDARGPALPVIAPLSAERLGLVFGRDHVVHVAVAGGRLADGLLADGRRWAGLTGMDQGFDEMRAVPDGAADASERGQAKT